MVAAVVVGEAALQEREVFIDEPGTAPKEEGDLSGLEVASLELSRADEGVEVVGDGFGAVTHDVANLAEGFSFEGEFDDAHAVGEDRADVVLVASQRQQGVGRGFAQCFEITRDGARRYVEDVPCEVFAGEQSSLTEGLLAKVRNAVAAPCRKSLFDHQDIVLRTTVQGEPHRCLAAIYQSLAARFVGIDHDDGDPSGLQSGVMGRGVVLKMAKEHFAHDLHDGLGFEGRTVQTLMDLVHKSALKGLKLEAVEFFKFGIADGHKLTG